MSYLPYNVDIFSHYSRSGFKTFKISAWGWITCFDVAYSALSNSCIQEVRTSPQIRLHWLTLISFAALFSIPHISGVTNSSRKYGRLSLKELKVQRKIHTSICRKWTARWIQYKITCLFYYHGSFYSNTYLTFLPPFRLLYPVFLSSHSVARIDWCLHTAIHIRHIYVFHEHNPRLRIMCMPLMICFCLKFSVTFFFLPLVLTWH